MGTNKFLLTEMAECRRVRDCIELATMDSHDEHEQAIGWLACMDELFEKGNPIAVLGADATLAGFDLVNGNCLVAVCRRGRHLAHVALESVKFKNINRTQALWLKAWAQFA